MQVLGQLQSACTEILSTDPSTSVQGRFWYNSTSGTLKLDDGTLKRSLLRNDGAAIIGNSGTAGSNIRLHRGATSTLQFVLGSDVTAEGSLSSSLAVISARLENYTDAGKPAAGNAGRLLWITDLATLKIDTGAAHKTLLPLTTKGDLYTYSTAEARLAVGSNGQVLKSNSATATGLEWATSAVGALQVVSKTASYTPTDSSDDVILMSASTGTRTIDLTNVSGEGKVLTIKKTDTSLNKITITPGVGVDVADLGSGSSSTSIDTIGETIVMVRNGTRWQITERRIPSIWVDAGSIATSTGSPNGAAAVNSVSYQRIGGFARIKWALRQAAAGTIGAGSLEFTFPNGLVVDSAKHESTSSTNLNNIAGAGAGPAGFIGETTTPGHGFIYPWLVSTTEVRIYTEKNFSTTSVFGPGGDYHFGMTNLGFSFEITVPIANWKG